MAGPIKKIFITIPWFLPAFRAGGPVQSIANLVKELNEEVSFFIFCGDTDLNGAELENITKGEWLDFNEHTKLWFSEAGKVSDSMVKQVQILKPDILYIIGMFSWHFNMVPLLFCKGPKKILSTKGMLHPGGLSQKKWKKKIYLQCFKLLEYHYKVLFHATDEEEARHIENYFGKVAKVFVAGNFPNQIGALPMVEKKPGYLKLISIAVISPMKNILSVLQALEKVKSNIQYDVYGPVKDEDYRDACKAQIKKLPANISVVLHKEIEPRKVKEVLQEAHVFILPSKSENFGHALYEAMSAGRPVITSHFTPWNQLRNLRAGINVSLDDGQELSDAIDTFSFMDEEAFSQWHHGAVAYAEKAVDVEKIKKEYERMFSLD
jgi:glycosyltransferase involved in cell wall biosynthesis